MKKFKRITAYLFIILFSIVSLPFVVMATWIIVYDKWTLWIDIEFKKISEYIDKKM